MTAGIAPVDLTRENLVEAMNRLPTGSQLPKRVPLDYSSSDRATRPGRWRIFQTPLTRFSYTQSEREDKPPRVDVNQSHGSLRVELTSGEPPMLGSGKAFLGNRGIGQQGRFQSFLRHIRIEDDVGLRGYSAAEVLRRAWSFSFR